LTYWSVPDKPRGLRERSRYLKEIYGVELGQIQFGPVFEKQTAASIKIIIEKIEF